MAWRLHHPSGVSLPAPLRLLKEPQITFYLVLDVCPQLRNILNARRALQTPRQTGSQYAMFVPRPVRDARGNIYRKALYPLHQKEYIPSASIWWCQVDEIRVACGSRLQHWPRLPCATVGCCAHTFTPALYKKAEAREVGMLCPWNAGCC